jgi:hypothetical protein
MRTIPGNYKQKRERASWAAGYRAGFDGRLEQTELRHKDLQPIYAHGYNEGRVDQENRAERRRREAEESNE